MKNPLVLIIMDGYGLSGAAEGNAIARAATPDLDAFFEEFPYCTLSCSGLDVGLPRGQMGNSEVGHANIGAGRVVYQDFTRISRAVENGDFFENPALAGAMDSCLKNGTSLHLVGLLSDGGVHSHTGHLWALLELARKKGLTRVYVHCLLDGRDTPPESGASYLAACLEKMKEIGIGKIATVAGRYYGMDRDNRWERVEQAYAAMVCGKGAFDPDPVRAVKASYAEGVTDEFVKPVVCLPDARVSAKDSVIFFNFRPDRARELTRAFIEPDFPHFERPGGVFPLYFVCLTKYASAISGVHIAFPPQTLDNILGEYISKLGYTQLRIAETEKYAHVTFFFNGGAEQTYPGEDRVLVPSPKVATYDLQPEMSAYEVTDEVCARIESGTYDLVVLNYANCDMVGHTGNFEAAVKAVETVDACVARVVEKVREMGGFALITADHGNAEKMLEDDGVTPFTAHTTNRVPFCIVGAGVSLRQDGVLADIAPTILDLMGLDPPVEMTGRSLIV